MRKLLTVFDRFKGDEAPQDVLVPPVNASTQLPGYGDDDHDTISFDIPLIS